MSTSLYFSNKVAPKNLTWIYITYFVKMQETYTRAKGIKTQLLTPHNLCYQTFPVLNQ